MSGAHWLLSPGSKYRVCLSGTPVWVDARLGCSTAPGYLVGCEEKLYPPMLYDTWAAARRAAVELARQLDDEYDRAPTPREQGYVNALLAEVLSRCPRKTP